MILHPAGKALLEPFFGKQENSDGTAENEIAQAKAYHKNHPWESSPFDVRLASRDLSWSISASDSLSFSRYAESMEVIFPP